MAIPQSFLDKLEDLRTAYNKPIIVTSGYRCPLHNASVSKTGTSGPHTKGAVDIAVSGTNAHDLLQHAMTIGFTGVGISQRGNHKTRFIHLDDLPVGELRPWIWSY
jgi:uncharacterized protein YcbK (DUF882 family)